MRRDVFLPGSVRDKVGMALLLGLSFLAGRLQWRPTRPADSGPAAPAEPLPTLMPSPTAQSELRLELIEARLARLDGLIESLPMGLDSPLGERGQQLSGGQKQRIAIARALLQDPLILVLDEATSAVDEATEREVIAAIDQLFHGRTRILISHRPSTLAQADVAFRLEHGQLHSLESEQVSHGR